MTTDELAIRLKGWLDMEEVAQAPAQPGQPPTPFTIGAKKAELLRTWVNATVVESGLNSLTLGVPK